MMARGRIIAASRGRMAALAVLAGLFASAAPPALAEPVTIGAALHEDYGRIVFGWNTPVGHETTVRDGRLTVRFRRPIEADYGRVTRALRKYVSAAAPGDDGRSVTFRLAGDFDVYSFDSGPAVIVEIADKASAEADQPAPDTGNANAGDANAGDAGAEGAATADLPTIRVRTGQHPDYTRVVFDWPSKVPYTFNQSGGVATVTFGRAARIDLDAIRARPPRHVGDARARIEGDAVTVSLSVPATSKVRHFLAGPKVVLDIRRPTGSETAGPLPPEKEPAPTAAVAAADAEPAAKSAAEAASAAPAATAKAAPAAPTPKDAPAKAETAAGTARPAPAAPPGAPAAGQTQASAAVTETKAVAAGQEAPGQPTRLTPKALAPTALTPPPTGARTGPATPPVAPGTAPTTTGPPAPPTTRQVTAQGTPQGTLQGTPQGTPQGTSKPPDPSVITLRFDWDEPVGAAVFRRAGTLWVVFDKPTPIDVERLRAAGGNVIKGVEQLGTSEGTVLRMATIGGINPGVRRDGLAWLLDFRKQPIEAGTSVPIKPQLDSPVGTRLFLPVAEPGEPIGVTDPDVGDNIVIVPLIPLGHGTAVEYVYPQMHFLPTAQGIVVRPRVDDIRVRALREGVEITSGSTLYVTEVSDEAAAEQQLAALKPLTRVLALEDWKIKDQVRFLPRKYTLLDAVARSRDVQREAARLDLARFYFSNGFHAEALAVLARIAQDRPEIASEPEYRMLTGGAQFMLGRLDEAAEHFNHPTLADNDEAIFWRAVVQAAGGDSEDAAKEMKRTGRIIRSYPQPLKTPLGTIVVKVAMDVGDVKQARHFLEILGLDKLNRDQKSRLAFQEGRVLQLTGDFDGAIGLWEKVRDGYDRPSRARAIVARMELLLKLERITKKEAIADLEKLRFDWRGDDFEFALLRRLGTLYLEEGRYREGLDRLRQAATYYRTHPDAPQVTQQMSDAFTHLFLENGADALAPVTALAIYDEFKELTPAGRQGDEMIRKLADRLVGVDLLDRAAALLANQVKFRLEGGEKARVGTQLALIHILAREYDAALQVLAETEVPAIPEPLASQRRHLQAKILLSDDKRESALAVLKGDRSEDAELLRVEAFWTARQWSDAAQSLRHLLRVTDAKPGEPLDERQAVHVLNYAIALTLAGNERALNRLRGDYGAAMDQSNLNNAFRLIATPASLGLINPANVSASVKEVEKFQSFMAAYRERLKSQNLSELVPLAKPVELLKPDTEAPAAETPAAPPAAPAAPPPAVPQVQAQPPTEASPSEPPSQRSSRPAAAPASAKPGFRPGGQRPPGDGPFGEGGPPFAALFRPHAGAAQTPRRELNGRHWWASVGIRWSSGGHPVDIG
ncbi:MAG: tetratricopeptide repeat protein [Rhodospirillales bacterium]